MLTTTDAIVMALLPHSDKAHLLHAYTRTGGRVNYMVYGLGRKHAAGLYTPFSLLQITADQASQQSAAGTKPPAIRSAQLAFVPTTTTIDPRKQTISLFLSEILFHTLKYPLPDEQLFDFLAASIRELDTLPSADEEQSVANFHLRFLAQFATHLGFALPEATPAGTSSLSSRHEHTPERPLSRTERQQALRQLCAYFAEHVDTWQTPRSLDILIEVFD